MLLSPSDVRVSRGADGRKQSLGEGGFGAVFRGILHGAEDVAIKVIKV